VFPRLEGVRTSASDPIARELLENLSRADDDAVLEATFRAYLAESSAATVFSRESLSGDWPDMWTTSWRNAERIKRLLPDARILAVVRRQEDLLPSLYWLYVRLGGVASFADFVADRAEGWRFDPRHLEFDRLLGRYVELFGRDDVLVLPYELLRTDPRRFLEDLCAFCGADGIDGDPLARQGVNSALSGTGTRMLRAWNGAFVASRMNPVPRFGARSGAGRAAALLGRADRVLRLVPAPDGHEEAIAPLMPAYAESNARLQDLCAYDLAGLGYAVPS
jgi:hypothetical protein